HLGNEHYLPVRITSKHDHGGLSLVRGAVRKPGEHLAIPVLNASGNNRHSCDFAWGKALGTARRPRLELLDLLLKLGSLFDQLLSCDQHVARVRFQELGYLLQSLLALIQVIIY